MGDIAERRSAWTFLTNHARVLVITARDPEARMRDIAAAIGITERAAQGIVTDLEEAGYLQRVRQGRRNRYAIVPGRHLRHHAESAVPVQALIDLFTGHEMYGGEPAAAVTRSLPAGRDTAPAAQQDAAFA